MMHKCKSMMSSKRKAKKYRKMGLNATVAKTKTGWKVYTDQKGRR